MNCKGTAIIAVPFPGGVIGTVIIAENPECLTVFCRINHNLLPNGLLEEPEIDVQVFRKAEKSYSVMGRGSDHYLEQVKIAVEAFFRMRLSSNLFKVVD